MSDYDELAAARHWESIGQLQDAIDEYKRLTEARLSDAPALVRQAALHKELGELDAAITALEQAHALEPHHPEPRLRLAQTATSIGRDIAAIRLLEAAIRDRPDLAELRVNLADICQRREWLDTAYWAVHHLPEQLPDWWARARKVATEQFPQARREVFALLRKRRAEGLDHTLTWELARYFHTLGRLTIALKLCRRLVEATPDAFPPHDLISQILARQQGPAAALEYLWSLPPALHDLPAHVDRSVRCLTELDRYIDVLAIAAVRPDLAESFDIRFYTAVALVRLGRFDQLRTHCRLWMRSAPQEVLPAGVVTSAQPVRALAPPEEAPAVDAGLIQFWDKADIPDDVRLVLDSWPDRHPGLRRTLFSEDMARDFLRDRLGGESAAAFDHCHHAAMKADYFRIAYLYVEGGLYVDADELCLRPMDALLAAAADAEIAAVRAGEVMGYLHNFFLGARAGSRALEIALEDANRSIATAHAEGRRLSIWEATGPGLITRAIGRYIVESPRPGAVMLLPFMQYRSFVQTASDLAYKRRGEANWQLA